MRIGFGYDVHKLVEGRPLILGGESIPSDEGLDGHSDADVLVHAVMDSLLGASGQGDIGMHFPPGDRRFKDVSSLFLLEKVREIIEAEGWQVENVDAVIVAQAPKLSPYTGKMRNNIGHTLGLVEQRVSVKATTTEGLGFAGRGLGIAAYAVALLRPK